MKLSESGLLYDTETATLLDEWECGGLVWYEYEIYKTPKGRLFYLYRHSFGEGLIVPESPDAIVDILMMNERYETLEKHFGKKFERA